MSDTRTPTEQMRDIRNVVRFIEGDKGNELLSRAAVIMDQLVEAAQVAYEGDKRRLWEVAGRAKLWQFEASIEVRKGASVGS